MVDGAGECWRYALFISPPNTLLDQNAAGATAIVNGNLLVHAVTL
jgi:hypothetical protein